MRYRYSVAVEDSRFFQVPYSASSAQRAFMSRNRAKVCEDSTAAWWAEKYNTVGGGTRESYRGPDVAWLV